MVSGFLTHRRVDHSDSRRGGLRPDQKLDHCRFVSLVSRRGLLLAGSMNSGYTDTRMSARGDVACFGPSRVPPTFRNGGFCERFVKLACT